MAKKKKGVIATLSEAIFGGNAKKTKPKKTSSRSRTVNSKDKRFQKHFRKFHDKKTTGHPSYVYGETGKDYKFLGITSAPKTNGVKNIPLSKNPEPGNPKAAFIRPTPDTISKGVRNERLKGWSFSETDKKKVRDIIDTHEKKK